MVLHLSVVVSSFQNYMSIRDTYCRENHQVIARFQLRCRELLHDFSAIDVGEAGHTIYKVARNQSTERFLPSKVLHVFFAMDTGEIGYAQEPRHFNHRPQYQLNSMWQNFIGTRLLPDDPGYYIVHSSDTGICEYISGTDQQTNKR